MIIPILSALPALAILFFITTRKNLIKEIEPHRETNKKWAIWASISGFVSAILLTVLTTSVDNSPLYWTVMSSVLIAIVTFVFVVSIWSDHKHRVVDKIIFRAANSISLSIGIVYLIIMQSEVMTVIYIVSLLCFSAMIFYTPIGASDTRAYILLIASSLPVMGVQYMIYAIVLSFVFVIGYSVIKFIQTRQPRIDVPLVPYILSPMIIMSFISMLELI